jgi:tetratricopeptide (TPR) repeat protein
MGFWKKLIRKKSSNFNDKLVEAQEIKVASVKKCVSCQNPVDVSLAICPYCGGDSFIQAFSKDHTGAALEVLRKHEEALRKHRDLNNEIELYSGIELFSHLLSLAQQEGDVKAEIEARRLLANAYQEKGQLRRAHSYRLEAAKIAEAYRSQCPPEVLMFLEADIGRTYIEVGDWQRAEVHTQRALGMAESLHDELSLCRYNMNLGVIYLNSDRKEEAFRLWTKVLPIAERLQDQQLLGQLHLNVAYLLSRQGQLNDSQHHAQLALVYADLSGYSSLRMHVHRVLGESFYFLVLTGNFGYSGDAKHHLQQSLLLARLLDTPFLAANVETELGQLCEYLRQPAEAENHYQQAIDMLEKVRSRLGYEEFQLAYFRSVESTYDEMTEFLLRQGKPDQTFWTAEQSRSRLLLGLLGQGRSNTQSWSTTQRSELKESLNFYGSAVMSQCCESRTRGRRGSTIGIWATDTDETACDADAVGEACQKFLDLYSSQRLKKANWEPWQSPPVVSFEQAQQFLGPNDALLAYLVTDKSIIIFVATDQERQVKRLDYPREKIANDVKLLCSAMNAVQEPLYDKVLAKQWFARQHLDDPWPKFIYEPMEQLHGILEELYALLVAPVLAAVDQKPHWVIVPHGKLHLLPWSALRGPDHYLVEKHTVSLLPSASLGVALEKCEATTADEAVFFADPDPDEENWKLPYAQEEVRKCCEKCYEIFQSEPFLRIGKAVTKCELEAYVPTARLLHFACHHLFDASAPLLSFLKMHGNAGNDFLYAFEVAEMNLSAEIVSLSACASGRSGIVTGDEQLGMVRAFLAAGARSVVSTLWETDDKSAAEFFAEFYDCGFEGRAIALAEAQRRLLADPWYTLPYFWAPYVLSGQWKKPLLF